MAPVATRRKWERTKPGDARCRAKPAPAQGYAGPRVPGWGRTAIGSQQRPKPLSVAPVIPSRALNLSFERGPDPALQPKPVDGDGARQGANVAKSDPSPVKAALLEDAARSRIGDPGAGPKAFMAPIRE